MGYFSRKSSSRNGPETYKIINFKGFHIMRNVDINVDGDNLIIKINLKQRHGLSSSKKTTIIASTDGNVSVPGYEDIKIGINAYTK